MLPNKHLFGQVGGNKCPCDSHKDWHGIAQTAILTSTRNATPTAMLTVTPTAMPTAMLTAMPTAMLTAMMTANTEPHTAS